MYKFGPYNLDPDAIRLFKKGMEVELEPQVFNTLLLLIKKRARVVSKDELLEKIWQGRIVSDHVITRVIYELRKILDEKNDKDSYIRTVRGKGYQFIANVHENEKINDSNTLSNEPKLIPATFSPKIFLLAIGFILLALVSVFFIQQSRQSIDQQKKSSFASLSKIYPTVAVLPISVETDNEELSMLMQSLIEYLTNQLSVNLNMKVIHPDNLVHMGEQLDDIWAIQKSTRADFIIQGFIESVTGQTINLHLTLHRKNEFGAMIPFTLGAFQFPYPQNVKDLNDLYKQRKVTIRSIIQIIKPGVTIRDNAETETKDPEAYRLVIAAHHISRNDDCKNMARAEQLLLKAVERDKEFVYAYLQLFNNYYKRVWICGESIEYQKKGLEMAEMVDRLAPQSFYAIAKRRSTILVESNQVEKAYEFAKDVDWNNPDTIYHQSYSLRYAGFLRLTSKNLNRILQLDPFYYNSKPILTAPNTLLYQNRFKDHLELLAEPGNSYHDYFRGLNLFLTGNVDQAKVILTGVIKRTPGDLFGKYSQSLLYIIENKNASAIDVVNSIVTQRNEKKHTDGEMTYKLAQLYAMAGDKDLALKTLQMTVDRGFFPMNYFLNDPALKSIQNTDEFSKIVKQATKRHEAFAEKFDLEPETNLNTKFK